MMGNALNSGNLSNTQCSLAQQNNNGSVNPFGSVRAN
jgi:hypothetical protein